MTEKVVKLERRTIDQMDIGQAWRMQRHLDACEYVIEAIEGQRAWVVNTKNGFCSIVDLSYKCKVYVEVLIDKP